VAFFGVGLLGTEHLEGAVEVDVDHAAVGLRDLDVVGDLGLVGRVRRIARLGRVNLAVVLASGCSAEASVTVPPPVAARAASLALVASASSACVTRYKPTPTQSWALCCGTAVSRLQTTRRGSRDPDRGQRVCRTRASRKAAIPRTAATAT
jgi:hypothetical protein